MSEAEGEAVAEQEDCWHCGNSVDPTEPGVFKTVSDQFAHRECVAEHCYNTRKKVATTEGVLTVESTVVKKFVGDSEEVLDSFWQADCPVCFQTHESEETDERHAAPSLGTSSTAVTRSGCRRRTTSRTATSARWDTARAATASRCSVVTRCRTWTTTSSAPSAGGTATDQSSAAPAASARSASLGQFRWSRNE